MYLGWVDYAVLVLLFIFSAGIGLYQGGFKSKQTSTKEFLIASGQMRILPTAMSLVASLTSAASFLGMPVEAYYYGTMFMYCIFSWLIATYVTMKFFIPKFHQIGNASIYAYLEQRFSLTIRIMVTCSFLLVTILYMAVIIYGPSLALSQVTGLNIWLSVGSCGLICTIYTSIGGMKAVIWTDVVQASVMFIGLILSIIFGVIDAGGISKVFETVKNGNRLQFTVFTFDPSIRYTIWSILIGNTFSSTAQYACIQTQAQRYMCVKDKRSAQKVAWMNYAINVFMLSLFLCVGCLLYAKYHQCDPLRANLISRPDQLYPLFVIETLGRFPGLTGLFISCVLSATLSTFSSGVNSMATVIFEDIYKRISNEKSSISNKQQVLLSKLLSVILGCVTVAMAFAVSYMKSNIITIIIQIFGAVAAPILGVFLLGLFSSRVKSRSVLVAFFIALIFQTFMLFGSILTVKPANKQGGRLPTSIDRCIPSIDVTPAPTTHINSTILLSLFSISPLWFIFNGTIVTIVFAMIFTFILDSKDSKPIDTSLLVSRNEIFPCFPSKNERLQQAATQNLDENSQLDTVPEQESMI
ncbi:unnamed protein product [Rotaria magnacalcarata]|uniref:Sodium-coupled monocarboxylate transporter 1 n=1 Tax=Rotaria magnacalcarata TaxID=392030 RepID=A0A816UCW1_9BILA|nr:unnamed protein product [Rotaria magnacalcarata]CAF2106627.1 unnamed protein product [Rotaria magnacalcarata]